MPESGEGKLTLRMLKDCWERSKPPLSWDMTLGELSEQIDIARGATLYIDGKNIDSTGDVIMVFESNEGSSAMTVTPSFAAMTFRATTGQRGFWGRLWDRLWRRR